MTKPNPWDWSLEARIAIADAQDAYERTYGHRVGPVTETAALTAVRFAATAYRIAIERPPGMADISALLENEYKPLNLAWLVENIERRQWIEAAERRTTKEIARWYKQEWRETNDAARFPATVNLTMRYDVRQLIDHFAESLGNDGAATPLKQLAPGSPERRRAAERLNIVDIEPRRKETPADERRFGAAFAEELEKLAADDGNGADACRLTARAAREALKSTANAREATRTSAGPALEG